MTKLEWCRENAPDALKGLPDDELLQYMQRTLNNDAIDKPQFDDNDEYADLMSMMDYMVLVLLREFGNKVAFKGGYMLSKLLPNVSRQTTDIDFSIQTSDLYVDLLNTFEEIGEHFVDKGMIARYEIKPEIREFMSGGMNMYSADGSKKLGIDVGWHDITFGTTSVKLDVGDVNAFSVERMLSDKITAILYRKRFRRPKDIYDLYCITNCFDFDATLVNDYIIRRTNGAVAEWRNLPFTEVVLREYGKAYNSLDIRAVSKKRFEKPLFTTVMERFDCICYKLRNPDLMMQWKHTTATFEVE